MIQQEEALGISISQLNTQTQYINTFDDLQVIKEEKNNNISQGSLSNSSLQQDLRTLNPLYQRVLNIINQDQFNSSKNNTNIPEEKEDELDDDSDDEYDEEEQNEEIEEQIYQSNTNQNENDEIRLRENSKFSQQSCDQREKSLSQNEKQEQYLQEQLIHLKSEGDVCKEESSSYLATDELKSNNSIIQSNLDDITHIKQVDSSQDQEKSRTNSFSKEVNTQNQGQVEEKLQLIDSQNKKKSDTIEIQNSENDSSSSQKNIFNKKRCSFEIDSHENNNEDVFKNLQKDLSKRKIQNSLNQEQSEENIISNNSASSIQLKNRSKKILSGVDVEQSVGLNADEEVHRSSNKIIKKKNEDKNNQDERNKNTQNIKTNRIIHIAKIDEYVEDLIVKEVQQACLVLKDKQLIQWDKNDLQNIILKSKYFQELTEVIEQNDIDGFMLFIVINEEMQLHNIPKLLNIPFSTATKLKSFIQILEPLRSEQMLKISKKKKQIRLVHSSSIDGDFVIESPELKTRNSNVFSSSNSRYIQNLIGMQTQQTPSMTNSQRLTLSAFYGGSYLKNSSKFNTTDQLQDSSEYEEQKMSSVNKNIKTSTTQPEKSLSQMFENQTRDKLLSSTSDQDNQNQNFKSSSEQQQNNMRVSEDKPQSNNTIFCYESTYLWTNSKNKSPNYNKHVKTQFQSQNLSISQNRTNLGLSSHFTSADNSQSYDERRNINSQPTLGTSFHFDRQSCGVSAHNTTPATEKIPDEDNCENSALTTEITAGKDSKDEFAIHPRLQKIRHLKLYPSKSTQLPNINLENQGTQFINSESQFETQNSIISNSTTPQNINTIHSAQIKGSYENITDIDQTPLSHQQMVHNSKHAQENNLGDSGYISTPLGFSQKVEKHVTNFQNQNRQSEGGENRHLRKQSSNGTLLQSEVLEQQQGYIKNNLVNSQQLNINNKEQQTEQLQNQMPFFTQSDNYDQQIKFKSSFQSSDSQLKFQPQIPIQAQEKQQQQSNNNIQNNLKQNNNDNLMIQNQNNTRENNLFYQNISGDQQQQIYFGHPQTTLSFYPLPNQNQNRGSIYDNNSIQQLQFTPFNQNQQQQSENNEIFQLKFQPVISHQHINPDNSQNTGQNNNSMQFINQNQQNSQGNYSNQYVYNQQNSYNPQIPSQNVQTYNLENNQVGSIILLNSQSIQSFNQVNSNNLNQQGSQNQQNQTSIQGQADMKDLKFNYGNSLSFLSYPQQQQQGQQQNNLFQNQQFNNNSNNTQTYQNFQQQNLNSQIPISNSSDERDQKLSDGSNNNLQLSNQMIQQQQIQYQQGNSFICYQNNNNNNNYENQYNNNQNNMCQTQNYVQGNSISFQHTQQPSQQISQQNQNNFQGNSIYFQQPNINYGNQNTNIHHNQQQNQNTGYNQGASIYFQNGPQMNQQYQNQQNLQQNNQIVNQQINIQQSNQGYSHYYYQQQQIDYQFNQNQYNPYQNNQQKEQILLNDNNMNQYYNYQQQYYQDPYNQNNMQQYQQENQGNNIGLKLPTIFLMDNNQHNSANDQVVNNQHGAYQDISHDNQQNQIATNQSLENHAINIQHQKVLKLQAKQNQVLKCTYNLPFNLFKFDVIPKIKVDIKGKSSDQHLKYYTFHSEGATIGRNINNSINFIEEVSISAFHAIIYYSKREFFIQDIKSKAGTFIKIKSTPITNDLKMKLGEVEIKFTKCEKGIVTFQTSSSSLKKGTIDMNQKSEVKIGRCKFRCDYVLQDSGNTVSFVHAQIHYNDEKQICITDLGSGNGTWLRLSEKSCRSNPFKLNLNDQIMISNTKKIVIVELES